MPKAFDKTKPREIIRIFFHFRFCRHFHGGVGFFRDQRPRRASLASCSSFFQPLQKGALQKAGYAHA